MWRYWSWSWPKRLGLSLGKFLWSLGLGLVKKSYLHLCTILKATQQGGRLYWYSADADWGVLDEGVHWRHPANTTESSVCGSDAALCQITLTTVYSVIVSFHVDRGNVLFARCVPLLVGRLQSLASLIPLYLPHPVPSRRHRLENWADVDPALIVMHFLSPSILLFVEYLPLLMLSIQSTIQVYTVPQKRCH